MKTIMRPAVLAFSLVTLALPGTASAFTCVSGTECVTHCTLPVRYAIGELPEGIPEADAIAEVQRAFDAWAEVSCSVLAFEYAGRLPVAGTAPAVTVEWTTDWRDAASSWATTGVTWSSECVGDAAIALNEADFDWSVAGAAPTRAIFAALLVEVGKAIGLGRSMVSGSALFPGAEASALGADDEEGVCALYPRGGLEVCDRCSTDASCGDDADRCVDYPDGASYCGRACTSGGAECGADEQCADVGAGETQCVGVMDGVRACRPPGPCMPCATAAQCAGGTCLGYPSGGSFCGGACAVDAECGEGHRCLPASGGMFCVRFVGDAPNCIGEATDGGVADAGAPPVDSGSDAGAGSPTSDGCGCRVAAHRAPGFIWLFALLGALVVARRGR